MSDGHQTWISPVPGGVELQVLVVPRASRDRVTGVHDGRLRVQIAAPPVDNAANDRVAAVIAALCGVRVTDVTILAGQQSRRKRLRVSGADAGAPWITEVTA